MRAPLAPFSVFVALLVVLGPAPFAFAADDVPPPPNPCLTELVDYTAVPWGANADDLPEEQRADWLSALSDALGWITNLAPEGNHLFHWTGDRAVLAKKHDVSIYLSTSAKVAAMPVVGPMVIPGSDAGTLSLQNATEAHIYTYLYVDRLLASVTGEPHPDVFARLIAALGHEIYGNVQRELERDFDVPMRPTRLSRAEGEVRAFGAGVAFLERAVAFAIANPEFVDETLAGQLVDALNREKRALAGWQAELERARP